ncbi:hypothetical protein HK097_001872 [Rhizophlyctis rosea]|uniref:Histidine kinase n=1 Tax=Rhizophlyctis rosea TaxID=64517 RepID=A0AAD5WYP5_9FUNG|nr:hypothetical protein HK097_001872 [Rhizophlyctis rosea]
MDPSHELSRSMASMDSMHSLGNRQRSDPKERYATFGGLSGYQPSFWQQVMAWLKRSVWLANVMGLLAFLVGAGISAAVLLALRDREARPSTDPIASRCGVVAAALSDTLARVMLSVHAMNWLIESNPNTTQTAFQQFFISFSKDVSIIPWTSYAPLILPAARPAFEARIGHPIYQSVAASNVALPVWKPDDTQFETRSQGSLYYPIQLTTAGYEKYIGFDVVSDSLGIVGINGMNLSLSLPMIQTINGTSVQIHRYILPWWGGNQTEEAATSPARGLFTGALRLSPLIAEVVENSIRNITMRVQIHDREENTYIYSTDGNTQLDLLGGTVATVAAAQRTWVIRCKGEVHKDNNSWVIFALLLILFLLLSILFRTAIRIWQALRPRTAPTNKDRQLDWMKTNAASILASLRDPLIIFDQTGYVIDANDEAAMVSKYDLDDFVRGVHVATLFPYLESKKKGGNGNGGAGSGTNGTNSANPKSMSSNSIRRDETAVEINESAVALPDAPSSSAVWPGLGYGQQEVTMKCKDGRMIEVDANFANVFQCVDTGEWIQAVVFRDLSSVKAVVKELQEAKEVAETNSMEKSNFLSFVLHELRNPLHAVIGLNTLLIQSLSAHMHFGRSHASTIPRSPNASPGLQGPSDIAPTPSPGSMAPHYEAMEHLSAISDAARLMRVIVNDMRVLSRLEAGNVELEKNVVDLQVLVSTVNRNMLAAQVELAASGESFADGASPSNVEMRLSVKGMEMEYGKEAGVGLGLQEKIPGMPAKEWFPPRVRVDATRLQQVLVNLISNSLKFTKTGTITLRAIVEKMREVNEAGQEVRPESLEVPKQDLRKQVCVRFEVEDTGKGIARSEIPKLFKTYSQSKLNRGDLSGTNVSLNVVASLLHMMGGEMHVQSQVAKGTRIWFALWMDVIELSPDDKVIDDNRSQTDIASTTPLVASNLGIGTPYLADLSRRPSMAPQAAMHAAMTTLSRARSPMTAPYPEPQQPTVPSSPDGQTISGTTPATPYVAPARIQALTRTSSQSPVTPSRRQSQTTVNNASGRGSISGPSAKKKSGESNVRRLGTHPCKDRSIRVLVVEDNNVIQKLAEKMLTRAGFEVRTANNGEEALAKIETAGKDWFDVCLMDLLMPIMDGFQATEEIRRRGYTLPVIALTAKSSESDRLRCLKIGFNYFTTKPFQLGDISTIIRYMVGAEGDQNAAGVNDGGPLYAPM